MMEQLAERRMQREEDAAGAIEAESDEDSEDDGDGSGRDDDGEEDGDMSDEDDDDDDEEDADEEVPYSILFSALTYHTLSRPCPRSRKWKKANECFLSLLHVCSNNVYCRPTERRSLKNANCSFSASLMTRTRLPGIVR